MVLAAQFLPTATLLQNVLWLVLIAVLLFVLEMVFYYVPGVSFSSLLIATASMYLGFVLTFIISLIAINAAHFILRRDISLFAPNLITLIPMIAFASFYGPLVINSYGWGVYGISLGVIKWGVALPAGFLFGRNIGKRVRELFLEPAANFFIFWKLSFLFMFLFL